MPALPPERADAVALADALAALAYPARLDLLEALRFPRPLGEIRIVPHRVAVGDNPDRAMSKQAAASHLEKLVEAGFVRAERPEEGGVTYVADAARIYALVEDLRTLCVRYSAQVRDADDTGTLGGAARPPAARGPRLVLVHGVYEGRAYPLPEEGAALIGRARRATVALDYDPFVSAAHAEVARDGDGFVLRDLADNKNGTALNWERLPRGGRAALAAGDVIGVGRSLLSFVGR